MQTRIFRTFIFFWSKQFTSGNRREINPSLKFRTTRYGVLIYSKSLPILFYSFTRHYLVSLMWNRAPIPLLILFTVWSSSRCIFSFTFTLVGCVFHYLFEPAIMLSIITLFWVYWRLGGGCDLHSRRHQFLLPQLLSRLHWDTKIFLRDWNGQSGF